MQEDYKRIILLLEESGDALFFAIMKEILFKGESYLEHHIL